MPSYWSRKDERMYKAIVASCTRSGRRKTKTCKRIAAATVNKHRSKRRRGTGSADCGCGGG